MALALPIAFVILAPASSRIVVDPVGPDLAPPAAHLAPGLPGAIDDGAGTYLPAPLDAAVSELLGFYARYPELAAGAIAAAREVERKQCEAERLRALAAVPPPAPWYRGPALVAIGFVAGAVAATIVISVQR